MATYKVAQDVEADDKLIGPFSFRQFIYLIIVAIAGVVAWGLSQLFAPLFVIPVPIMIFFGALALPLRKDQPMEVYLAAIVAYHLKPRHRLWCPDGVDSLIEITTPDVVEVQRAKDISQIEAERRLSYLADIADTKGWSIRHMAEPIAGTSMNSDAFYAAQQTEDMLDTSGAVGVAIDNMINQADEHRRQEMVSRMQQAPAPAPAATANPATPLTPSAPSPMIDPALTTQQPTGLPQIQYNPYPLAIHQTVIQPLSKQQQTAAQPQQTSPATLASSVQKSDVSTSETPISPDIINLASNPDLSIETISREAHRIEKRSSEGGSGEVFISLH